MRRLAFLLLVCVLTVPACKSKKKRPPLNAATQATLSTMVSVADPHASLQLLKGFYDVEGGSWRWTARTFSAEVRPPKDASRKGATLVLKFAIPDVVIQKLNAIRLSATANGMDLPPQEYAKPGEYTYSRDVASTVFQGDRVLANFALDKSLPPTPTDERELGVIVKAIGFEAR